MTDHIDPNNPLVTELADARERVAVLEQRLEEQQARTATPEEHQEAVERAEGQKILDAVQRGRDKNTKRTRI